MKGLAEDMYIVVGAQAAPGAHYRKALSGQPGNACLGLGRSGRPGTVRWDAQDKNLLWVDLCRTYDSRLRQALQSFMDGVETPPSRITIIFAAGRGGSEQGKPAADRRRSPDMRCFDALALKNISSMIEEIAERRAAETKKPVSLHVAALSDAAAPKTTLEAFVGKFASARDREARPWLAKSGLVLRTDVSGLSPAEQAMLTLPHIISMAEGKSALVDICRPPDPEAPGLPDAAPQRNLFYDREDIPRRLWSSLVRPRPAREPGKTGVMSG